MKALANDFAHLNPDTLPLRRLPVAGEFPLRDGKRFPSLSLEWSPFRFYGVDPPHTTMTPALPLLASAQADRLGFAQEPAQPEAGEIFHQVRFLPSFPTRQKYFCQEPDPQAFLETNVENPRESERGPDSCVPEPAAFKHCQQYRAGSRLCCLDSGVRNVLSAEGASLCPGARGLRDHSPAGRNFHTHPQAFALWGLRTNGNRRPHRTAMAAVGAGLSDLAERRALAQAAYRLRPEPSRVRLLYAGRQFSQPCAAVLSCGAVADRLRIGRPAIHRAAFPNPETRAAQPRHPQKTSGFGRFTSFLENCIGNGHSLSVDRTGRRVEITWGEMTAGFQHRPGARGGNPITPSQFLSLGGLQ